jgi:hypothetical protein
MSDGDWRKELGFGLIALACALLICLPIAGLMLNEYAEVHRANAAYQQNAEKDRKDATKKIEASCFATDRAVVRECLRNKIEAYYKQQATNYDLQAQQDMAYWAKAVFFLGAMQLILSVVGIRFVWRSLQFNAKAVEAAFVAVHADNRPWLKFAVEPVSDLNRNNTDFFPEGVGLDIKVLIKNLGHSPAHGVKVIVEEASVHYFDFFNDRYLDKWRETVLDGYDRGPKTGHTVYQGEEESVFVRLLISEKGLTRSPRLLRPSGDNSIACLDCWYTVSICYRSSTNPISLETSKVCSLWMKNDRHTLRGLGIGIGDKFKIIPKGKIVIREYGHERTN